MQDLNLAAVRWAVGCTEAPAHLRKRRDHQQLTLSLLKNPSSDLRQVLKAKKKNSRRRSTKVAGVGHSMTETGSLLLDAKGLTPNRHSSRQTGVTLVGVHICEL